LDSCIDFCISFNQHKYAMFNGVLRSCYCVKNLSDELKSEVFIKKDLCKDIDAKESVFQVYKTGLQGKLLKYFQTKLYSYDSIGLK
jgi:hypothetical protein